MARGNQDAGCGCRVLVSDVLGYTGGIDGGQIPPDAIAPNWHGEPSVPVAVAERVVAEHRATSERSRREAADRRADREDHEAERADVWQAAYQPVYDRFIEAHPTYAVMGPDGPSGGRLLTPSRAVQLAAAETARAAATAAVEAFDRKNRRAVGA